MCVCVGGWGREPHEFLIHSRLPVNAATASAARQSKASHFSPSKWQDYFETSLDVSIPNTSDISFFKHMYYACMIPSTFAFFLDSIHTYFVSIETSPTKKMVLSL